MFELVVSNVGAAALVLPWSDNEQVLLDVPNGAETREAKIDLIIVTTDRKRVPVHRLRVFGSSLHPGTLRTIAPGEAVRIRAKGLWAVQEEFSRAHLSNELRAFNVQVEISLGIGGERWTEAVAAVQQEVRLRLPQ